ncbi:tetratricopeptide repeat protein [Nodularia sp. NIES-3585]|uniref:tetratricopeptide repeat protein n=1 Tax=Nodularia sp. NIES-3585 TaxID=1973477 RepID=UPI000B5CFB80|nr:tetratricopeptide repeat protein [Nodularia sp. NIES-3585]GAX36139.1 TPR repeat-containing protein [Nodularia sp. NIES-3585]
MNIDDAVKFTQSVIENHSKQPLNDCPMAVLRGSLQGDSYSAIAKSYKFDKDYTKTVGSDLWKKLSAALGVKVTKNNLRSVIERHLPPEQQQIFNAENLPRCNDEIIYIVGRDEAISDINTLVSQRHKIILIQAAGGVGKSTLAKEYLNTQGFELVLQLEMAKDKENITAVESVVEEWLKQDFQEEPGREFGITLTRLRRQLQTRKVGILIDNLEPALDKQGRFIEKHSLYVELFRVLADSSVQSVTLITSRERLSDERVNGICPYPLSVLDVTAWEEFFTSFKIKTDADTLSAMHKVYGGNAKAMDILLGVMRTDFDGDMAAYWQENSTLVETELKNLVDSQFNRLQTLDTEAYKLLCRLGCFRYQDVPRVSSDALLALLWDVPEDKQRRIIKSLRNRCVVEFEKGEYWLHPIIREQGIERLKSSGEWKEVNRKAANFWDSNIMSNTTSAECIKQLEAIHHYLILNDWNKASKVVVKEISDTTLVAKLRSFGYIRKCLEILYFLRDKPNIINLDRSRIWVYIGTANYIAGKIKSAIYECKKAINLLEDNENNCCKSEIYIDWNGALAILYMNIGEYKESINIFAQLIPLTERIDENGRKFLAYIYSSLSISYFNIAQFELSLNYLNLSLTYKSYLETTSKSWIKSYGFYNLIKALIAHDQLNYAIQLCEQLTSYSELTYFPQAQGFAMCGLGSIYRKQVRLQNSCEQYEKAICIFEQLGAKCDLAEAYYQLGLTYQNMGETEKSYINFDEAIRLFSEMEAPKQVEKVEKAKRGNID